MRRNITFIGLYIANVLGSSIYSVVPPYLPNEAKNKSLNSTMTGLILSGYPVTAFLSSIVLANHITRAGKKRVLLLGAFAEMVATLGFSFLPTMNKENFICFGILLRLLQGLGAGFVGTAVCAIVVSDFADELQKYLGILQTSAAVGFLAGPFGASLLYSIGGFELIFQVYPVIYFLFMPFVYFLVPPDSPFQESKTPLTSFQILKTRKVQIYALALVASNSSLCYLSPTYSLHLEDLNVPKKLFGVIFGLPTITYVLAIVAVTNSKSSKNSILVLGLVILSISCFLVGPWHLPQNVYISVFGILLIGVGICNVQLTGIPKMISKAQKTFSEYPKEQISDICSGISNALAFFAELFSPPLSGLLCDQIGFNNSVALFGFFFILLTFFIYSSIRLPSKPSSLLSDFELNNISQVN